eukprot:TRINITY_DN9466_c0_g1_i1.p2 TRINITY_DN9466_c0_g1~~TRINITY_DN9466_c0_g1_i1.p2  ORF type:complete len:148 (-),score=27.79 TRINITY_DN9466_c0_g1_i1:145-588(-)
MPVVTYARIFGEQNGRGEMEIEAYQQLVHAYGEKEAKVHRAMCWFLMWGSWTGNTLNGFVGRKPGKPGASRFFLFTFFLWYVIPFFGIINTAAFFLRFLPPCPKWFNAIFGVVLITVASLWKVPLALIAVCFGIKDDQPSSLTAKVD